MVEYLVFIESRMVTLEIIERSYMAKATVAGAIMTTMCRRMLDLGSVSISTKIYQLLSRNRQSFLLVCGNTLVLLATGDQCALWSHDLHLPSKKHN